MSIVVRFTPAGLTAERTFGKLLPPVLAEVGITAAEPPAQVEVHNINKR